MRTLLVLLAVAVSLGVYYSEEKTGPEADPARPGCSNAACRVHGPYLKARTPGCEWPTYAPRYDPNCDLESYRRPPKPLPPDSDDPHLPGTC